MTSATVRVESAPGAPALEVARLQGFLREKFGLSGDLLVRPTSGGLSNPTYFLRCGDWTMVLRKQPASVLLKSAHAIDREFRVMGALQGSTVPVPKPIYYHSERDVLDTPFYLMERIEGRVFNDYSVSELPREQRRAAFRSMAHTMAALHNFDWRAAGLEDFGRSGNYFARQFKRWAEQWAQFRDDSIPDLDRVIAWLSARLPESETLGLCHGDFRIANLIFHPTEPRVLSVLDWELSTLGHPLVDVAFNTQAWLMAPDENGGVRGLDLEASGIPSEEEYLDWYYEAASGQERLARFHRVFAMFRAAVGAAGVAARGRAGNAFTNDAAEIGARFAKAYARRGAELIERGA